MKKIIITFSLALLFLTFYSCETDLSQFGNHQGVFGVVFDERTNEPISNAVVFLNGATQLSTYTDINGNYRFESIKTGNYVLSAEREDYKTSFIDVPIGLGDFPRMDIPMEYRSMLSTDYLDFGTSEEELEIVVTNLLDRPVDVDTEENAHWILVSNSIFGLDPGESGIIKVKALRYLMNNAVETAPLVINIEEDFGFDILESYVVDIRAER